MRCMECENKATIRVKDRALFGMRVRVLCDQHTTRALNANFEPIPPKAMKDIELEVIE